MFLVLSLLFAVWTGACTRTTAPSPEEGVLLRDDFNGPMLNSVLWSVPIGTGTFLGRTQLRPSSESLQVTGGVLRLRLDTYNPSALVPGDSFFGSEIVSRQTFSLGNGVAFLARVRLVEPSPGMVASFFSYRLGVGARDEIDFEVLTNHSMSARVLTNVFRDQGFRSPGNPLLVVAPGFTSTSFSELEFEWLPGRVRWKVNGQVVREEVEQIPTEPMTVRLNFWVPAADFVSAYDSQLRPASTVSDNRTFFYEVDWVEVRALNTGRIAFDAP